MITVKIIKDGYGHKPGQVLRLNEFAAGHLTAFGYAVNYVEPKVEPVIETQMVAPQEVRGNTFIDKRQDPVKLIVEPEQKVKGFLRRGRPRNKEGSRSNGSSPRDKCRILNFSTDSRPGRVDFFWMG